MALLEWKPEYSVGIDAIDHEHRELIELINRLHGRLLPGAKDAAAESFFGDLLRSISAHFALEEKFMREHRYDEHRQHKDDHERLLDEIRDIMDDFASDDATAHDELARRLDTWFTRHFETHDARLHRALGPSHH